MSALNQLRAPENVDLAIGVGLDQFEAAIQAAPLNPVQQPDGRTSFRQAQLDASTLEELRAGDCSSETFSRYVELSIQSETTYGSQFADVNTHPLEEENLVLSDLQRYFSPIVLQEKFNAEGDQGILHKLAHDSLAKAAGRETGTIARAVTFLQTVYGAEHPNDLVRPTDDTYAQSIRTQLLQDNNIHRLYFTQVESKLAIGEKQSVEVMRAKAREWARDLVLRATAIDDPELADSYVYSSTYANYDDRQLGDIIRKMDVLGPDRLAAIREFSGNFALQDYSMDQLERLALLAQGDEEEIKRLQQHDVIVTFTNKMGDHNRVLEHVPSSTEDAGRRTIPIEIETARDIFLFRKKLSDLGISPSVLVFGAHNDPGELELKSKPPMDAPAGFRNIMSIHSAAYAKLVNLAPEAKGKLQAFALRDMKAFRHLVDTWMQPSRGIDDPDVGKKKIAFIACNAATDAQVVDVGYFTNSPAYTWEQDSVAGRMAKDLAANGAQSDIEIYAAPAPIQARRTKTGFEYTEYNTTTSARDKVILATKFSVSGGRVVKTRVPGVVLTEV